MHTDTQMICGFGFLSNECEGITYLKLKEKNNDER